MIVLFGVSLIISKPYVLTGIKKLTPLVSSFVYKAQDSTAIDFVPGMFAMLEYRNANTGEKIARAFSIANPPPSNELEFLISLIHGRFTSKLDDARIGDVYYVSAPYGQFKFDINSGSKFLFLAGGTGIAPFMSMLKGIEKNSQKVDCRMIYSVRYPEEVINVDELGAIEKRMSVKTIVTVTRPKEGDDWNGEKGHVDSEMILRHAPDVKERTSYICGPPAFVKALKAALILLGVEEKNIHAEMWGE